MTRSDFARLLRRISSELKELAQTDREDHIDNFVALGRHYGIDVITEILHKGRAVSTVFSMIEERKTQRLKSARRP